jgi:hypothetical protein
MPKWSGYAGEPFNLSERRPLEIVSETDSAFVVNGFYHQGAFWKAMIPKCGVAEIVAQRLNFSKAKRQPDGTSKPSLFFLNHVQARIKMRPESAVLLYAADADMAEEPAHRISDFCYSVEAVGPHGRRWNVSDALLGNLAIVHRFISIYDVVFERIIYARMKVLQSPPLPLDPEICDTLLQAAVRRSSDIGLSMPYFMFRVPFSAANCTSEPLNLLDQVVRTPAWQHFFHRLPIHPRGYLKLRGLWREGPAQTLNEEMADWIASDEAKQRREIHSLKKKQLAKTPDARKIPIWKNLTSFVRALRA